MEKGVRVETEEALIINPKTLKNGTCRVATLDKNKVAVCKSGNEIRIYPVEE